MGVVKTAAPTLPRPRERQIHASVAREICPHAGGAEVATRAEMHATADLKSVGLLASVALPPGQSDLYQRAATPHIVSGNQHEEAIGVYPDRTSNQDGRLRRAARWRRAQKRHQQHQKREATLRPSTRR